MTAPTGLEVDHAAAVELPWVEWGAVGGARTALLLHGLSSAGPVWWRVADELAGHGFRVVAPDLRGHGVAPRTLHYRLGQFAADALRLRPSADVPWDVVVGHSLGGATAVLALRADPGWARTAVLVDPALRVTAGRNAEAFRAVAISEVENPDPTQIQAAHPDWHPQDVQLKVQAAHQASRHTVEGVLKDTTAWDLSSVFDGITTPVTILGADPDRPDAAVPPELGRQLARAHPAIHYTIAAGAGHSIHRSHPSRIVREIMAITAAA